MATPSGPLNGQGRVVEGLVLDDGTTAFRRGVASVTPSGSTTNSADQAMAWPPSLRIAVTPTLDTAAYASGDSLHTTVLSFANAVRTTAGSGVIEALIVSDHDVQSAAGELWLFSATVTPATVNTAHSISDAHADLCVGVIPFGPYYASALNSVSVNRGIGLPFSVAATTLFGILVTRGTPTYTASGLVVGLQISRD